ncbi:TetR/AcrR family transcriptional regulator [Bifidobacterium sp. SO1]|uniref:TetR/AcrR family transcriptional regulator n=1 Tax=Bifidobacterium sp. SO1 TaxID=2809029 RepID=UPI001BDC9985|nr:TetR/AcrR family transcriptional regulator [Bifidobacterium sp. SO1]MBT1161990.1 TetR/AcrR family transcriptional regulator [Bifidobacterium sp. SO1]
MTSLQRREQLIQVGRALFAAKGFEAVSVEEIAATAKVSKPIVYEHFGGKEGLYAVIVDREMQTLTSTITATLTDPDAHPRQIVERAALALLTYIEQNADGFQVLVRDSPSTDPAGSFSSLLGDISLQVEDLLTASFKRQKLSTKGVPYYAQMLVGMIVFTGQYWADRPKVSKEQLAAYIVDLAWHGLSRLDSKPALRFEGKRARNHREDNEPRPAAAQTTDGSAERQSTARSDQSQVSSDISQTAE